LRHRVTHPKIAEELIISDSELEFHKDAFAWFLKVFRDLQVGLVQKHDGSSC